MGMFTTINNGDKSYQIKCGYDDLETFNLGDKVPQKIFTDRYKAGYLLDDIYDGCGYPHKDAWIVIKDATVVHIEEFEDDPDARDEQYERLAKQFPPTVYPNSCWTQKAIDQHNEAEAKHKAEHAEFEKSIAHLSDEEKMIKRLVRPMSQMMEYQLNAKSIAQEIFKVEPLPMSEGLVKYYNANRKYEISK